MSVEKKFNRKRQKKWSKFNRRGALSLNQRKAINSMVTRRINSAPEKKWLDFQVFHFPGQTGFINTISNIPQGDSSSERIGDKVKLQSLAYRIQFTVSTTDTRNVLRFVMFQLLDDNVGLSLQYSDIFQHSTGGSPSDPSELMSPLRIVNRLHPFKILLDKHIQVNDYNPTYIMEGFINKFARTELEYNTTAGGRNQIYYGIWSDSSALPDPGFEGYFRIRYTDA